MMMITTISCQHYRNGTKLKYRRDAVEVRPAMRKLTRSADNTASEMCRSLDLAASASAVPHSADDDNSLSWCNLLIISSRTWCNLSLSEAQHQLNRLHNVNYKLTSLNTMQHELFSTPTLGNTMQHELFSTHSHTRNKQRCRHPLWRHVCGRPPSYARPLHCGKYASHDKLAVSQHAYKICIIFRSFQTSSHVGLWPLVLKTGALLTPATGNIPTNFGFPTIFCGTDGQTERQMDRSSRQDL